MLKENYEKVKENIVRACEKAGRSPEDVKGPPPPGRLSL